MDFLKAVNIIGRDLEEAMALLEQLSGVSGSDLAEIELARSRVRSAADLLKLLPALGGTGENRGPGSNITMTGPQAAARAAEAGAKTSHKAGTLDSASDVTRQPEEVSPAKEPVPEVSQPVTTDTPVPGEKDTISEVPRKEPVLQSVPAEEVTARHFGTGRKNQEQSKAILADRFTMGGTIGEKITTGKKEEVISTVIQGKPITDIAAAIGINDRFYFIRELFSGDARAYSDTIGRLNAAASLGEAMKILDESTVMGSDPAAQSTFVDVVRRKFSLNV